MIFRQVDEIISRAKTQTRRVIKSGERRIFDDDHNERFVLTPGGRLKWREGYDYAVVSKRGTRGVWWSPASGDWYVPDSADDQRAGYAPLRIVITAIRQERLHQISDKDAIAEGVLPDHDIISAGDWYGVSVSGRIWVFSLVEAYQALWRSINKAKGTRWGDNPDVWVIEFEVMVPDGWCPGCREFVAGSDDDFAARHDGICYECWQDMRAELGEYQQGEGYTLGG